MSILLYSVFKILGESMVSGDIEDGSRTGDSVNWIRLSIVLPPWRGDRECIISMRGRDINSITFSGDSTSSRSHCQRLNELLKLRNYRIRHEGIKKYGRTQSPSLLLIRDFQSPSTSSDERFDFTPISNADISLLIHRKRQRPFSYLKCLRIFPLEIKQLCRRLQIQHIKLSFRRNHRPCKSQ